MISHILCIETSGTNCSVAIFNKDQMVILKETNTGSFSHAENLHKFIEEALNGASLSFHDISAIAVSMGPGSYTGLRIGVSAAKGLCFALNIPLIAIPTLRLLANAVKLEEGVVAPMLDARRMEVYAALYDVHNGVELRETKAEVLDENSYHTFLKNGIVTFVGDAVNKAKELIVHENANFIEDIYPSALEMGTLAFEKFQQQAFEDVAYFEPYYLKDFVAGR